MIYWWYSKQSVKRCVVNTGGCYPVSMRIYYFVHIHIADTDISELNCPLEELSDCVTWLHIQEFIPHWIAVHCCHRWPWYYPFLTRSPTHCQKWVMTLLNIALRGKMAEWTRTWLCCHSNSELSWQWWRLCHSHTHTNTYKCMHTHTISVLSRGHTHCLADINKILFLVMTHSAHCTEMPWWSFKRQTEANVLKLDQGWWCSSNLWTERIKDSWLPSLTLSLNR